MVRQEVTAVSLDTMLSVGSKFLNGIVFAADARHRNLALSRRVAVIKSACVGIAASPAMLIALMLGAASARALKSDGSGGTRTRNLRIQSALLLPIELRSQREGI